MAGLDTTRTNREHIESNEEIRHVRYSSARLPLPVQPILPASSVLSTYSESRHFGLATRFVAGPLTRVNPVLNAAA